MIALSYAGMILVGAEKEKPGIQETTLLCLLEAIMTRMSGVRGALATITAVEFGAEAH